MLFFRLNFKLRPCQLSREEGSKHPMATVERTAREFSHLSWLTFIPQEVRLKANDSVVIMLPLVTACSAQICCISSNTPMTASQRCFNELPWGMAYQLKCEPAKS